MAAIYDSIGKGYRSQRVPDERIAKQILDALGPARRILNVGAGAGSYEPTDRSVFAAELSARMIAQRPEGSAPVVQANVEQLPFADSQFDACLGVLTLHHWSDAGRGLREMRRVAKGRVVLLTWLADLAEFWLYDYFPELLEIDRPIFPGLPFYQEHLGTLRIEPVSIPADCIDGFMAAYWARPERYLDPAVRASMSTFTKIDAEAGVAQLARDLESGVWRNRYGKAVEGAEGDFGYRLVIAD